MASYERKQAGVILYELFVGTPPFYTNSIYSLIHHIVKSPVAFPPDISPEFKGFLAGLLNKDPAQRLAWPVLLHHPFVATHVGKGELEQEHHLERVSLPPNSLNLPTTTVCLPIRLLSMLKIAFFCFFFSCQKYKKWGLEERGSGGNSYRGMCTGSSNVNEQNQQCRGLYRAATRRIESHDQANTGGGAEC